MPHLYDDIVNWDTIVGPLPTFNLDDLRGSKIGLLLDDFATLESIKIVAACTDAGDEYISSRMKCIVVIGLGDGLVGVPGQSWGTAGNRPQVKSDGSGGSK